MLLKTSLYLSLLLCFFVSGPPISQKVEILPSYMGEQEKMVLNKEELACWQLGIIVYEIQVGYGLFMVHSWKNSS